MCCIEEKYSMNKQIGNLFCNKLTHTQNLWIYIQYKYVNSFTEEVSWEEYLDGSPLPGKAVISVVLKTSPTA